MVQYVSVAVHLKYRMIQLFCYYILVIAVQGKTQIRVVRFMQVPKFVDIIENANDTILNIFGEVRSSIECVLLCSKHVKCKSVFIYKEEKHVCQLLDSVLNDLTEPVAKAEARYYKRVENTKGKRTLVK